MPFDTMPRTGFLLKRQICAGNVGAERGEDTDQAFAGIGCAADDFDGRLALFDFDLQHAQLVGVWMLLGFQRRGRW